MRRLKTSLPEPLAASVKSTISEWQASGKMKRLWQRDASLWTGSDEASWLGWLDITEEQIAQRINSRKSLKTRAAAASVMFFCWAWAAPAFARKFCR